MIKPKDLKAGQTIYIIVEEDIHETTVTKAGRKWVDVKPFKVSWHVKFSMLKYRSEWVVHSYKVYQRRERGGKYYYVHVCTDKRQAQDKVEAIKLASKLKLSIDCRKSLSVLKKIEEILNND